MSNIERPDLNSDRPNPIAVQKTEADKKDPEELPEPEQHPPYSPSEISVLHILKKFFTFLAKVLGLEETVDKAKIRDDLLAFKKILSILQDEDQSHNAEFTEELSESWHSVLQDAKVLNGEKKKYPVEAEKIRQFIEKINLYPPGADHPLGLYLTEYAGKEWIPFPFLDMLYELHRNHQESPNHSRLTDWVSSLSDLILTLGG